MNMKLLLAASAVFAIAGAAQAGTDYSFVPSGDIGAGQYGVETTPFTQRPDGAWGNYSAPDGSSAFQVFNGATTDGTRFWFQSGNVVSGGKYDVTLVIANNYAISAPVIQFSVNGIDVDPSVTLGGPPYGTDITDGSPGPWVTYHFSYTAGSTGSVVFALTDTNTDGSGNDFSVASASVNVPEPAAWALMISGMFGIGAALRLSRRRTAALAA